MKRKLCIIGFGVVGQGFAELLLEKSNLLKEKYKLEAEVVAIYDKKFGGLLGEIDLHSALKAAGEKGSFADLAGYREDLDPFKTIEESKADVVIELTYTNIETGEPACSYIKKALQMGKHVITTNKGPIALFYPELKEMARSKEVKLKFEGTVLSGTPAINFALKTLAGTKIERIRGIVNGTTNFILTEMGMGKSYEEALKKAQQLGYAEAVPDADVEGWDAMAKILILANVIMESRLTKEQVERKGITGISMEDIKKAKAEGKKWKLVAECWRENSAVKARVAPQLVGPDDFLFYVDGVTNALVFQTDTLSSVTVVGPGAGRRETGFSVLSDLIDIHLTGGEI